MAGADLHRPGDVDRVGDGGAELGEGRDVDGPGRTAWLLAGLVGGQRVGQRAELAVDLHRDGGGEVVLLLAGRLQQGEPDDDLSPVLGSARLCPVAGVGDVAALAGRQVEGEVLLLEPPAVSRLETVGLQESFLRSPVLLVGQHSPGRNQSVVVSLVHVYREAQNNVFRDTGLGLLT